MASIFSFLGTVAKLLKGHPDGILVVGLLGAYIGGSLLGLSEWPFVLVVLVIWGGYLARCMVRDRHTERMKELEVASVEAKGEQLKRKYRKPRKTKGTP